jgi:hypothetical protein
MLMKTLELGELLGVFDGIYGYPFVEDKAVIVACCRLLNNQRQHRKLKVYPGMLMKTHDLKNDFGDIREC